MDAKVQLQIFTQLKFGDTPWYFLLEAIGPDHCQCFKVAAQAGEKRFPAAWGNTRKDAEQNAAMNPLAPISGDPPPYTPEYHAHVAVPGGLLRGGVPRPRGVQDCCPVERRDHLRAEDLRPDVPRVPAEAV